MAADELEGREVLLWGSIHPINPDLPWATKIQLGIFCAMSLLHTIDDHALLPLEKPRAEWVPPPIMRYEEPWLNWPAWRVSVKCYEKAPR